MRISKDTTSLQFAVAAALAAGLLASCSGGGGSGSAAPVHGTPAPTGPVPNTPDEAGIVVLPLATAAVRTRVDTTLEAAEERVRALETEWRVRGARGDQLEVLAAETQAEFEAALEELDGEIARAHENVAYWTQALTLRGSLVGAPHCTTDGTEGGPALSGDSLTGCQAVETRRQASTGHIRVVSSLHISEQHELWRECINAGTDAGTCSALRPGLDELRTIRVILPDGMAPLREPGQPRETIIFPAANDNSDGAERAREIYFQVLRAIGEQQTAKREVQNYDWWRNALVILRNARAKLVAQYDETQRQIRLDLRGATETARDQQAILNVVAGARAPATPQDGQRFAQVRAAPRRTGAALEFDTAGNDIDSAADDAVFFDPHGTSDEQLQYRVQTSGTVNADQDIVARDGLLYEDAAVVLPAAVPPSSDASVISHASGDAGRFPARGTVFRGGLRGAAARVVQDGANWGASTVEAIQRRLQIQGDDSDRETDGAPDDAYAWKDWHAAPFTTFRYDGASGWSMGFGGSGVVFADLMRYAAKPEGASSTLAANQANDDVANNIEISFGDRPAGYAGLDPHIPAYYWNLKAPSLRRDASGELVDGAEQEEAARFDGGRYELLLSSYAGFTAEVSALPTGSAYRIVCEDGTQTCDPSDRQMEIWDLDEAVAPDGRPLSDEEKAFLREAGLADAQAYSDERGKLDPDLHLKHAAYGLFAFTSRFGGDAAVERLQTFHFGRQTFADEAGNRVSDIAGSLGIVASKYYGRTMGWLLTSADAGGKSADGRISGRHRIRGDVELHLDVFGHPLFDPNGAPGAVAGEISNLQIEVARGQWSTSGSDVLGTGTAAALRGTIGLNAYEGYLLDGYDVDNLNQDGTYDGAALPVSPIDEDTFETLPGIAGFFGAGEFEGALYGRNTRIPETAGTWWVPARLQFEGAEGMIGSFGAFCGEQLGCSPAGPDVLPDP